MNREDFEPLTIFKNAALIGAVFLAITLVLFLIALLAFIFGPAHA